MSKSEQVSAGPFCLSSALTNLVLKILRWTGIPHLASQTVSQTGRLIHSLLMVLLTVMMVLTASFFLYATFYYAYMPAKLFEEELSLKFATCPTSPSQCTYPNATVKIEPRRFRLVPGQSYSVGVVMELPGSTVNKELGMFLSCLKVISSSSTVDKVCRSSVQEFRSNLLHVVDDLFFLPFALFGSSAQKQTLRVLYYRDFVDDSHHPVEEMVVEIQSTFIQIYSIHLEIHAQFSGLRHIMHQFPITSSVIGINFVIIFLSSIIFISWNRFNSPVKAAEPAEITQNGNGHFKNYLNIDKDDAKTKKY